MNELLAHLLIVAAFIVIGSLRPLSAGTTGSLVGRFTRRAVVRHEGRGNVG